MSSNYSESQLQLAQAYASVREATKITRIDENGFGHPAEPQPLSEIVALLGIDNYKTYNK
jgi:preprotein translocase subunit Sec63